MERRESGTATTAPHADENYLSVQRVPIVSVENDTLKFYREYVALSRPVIIDNLSTGQLWNWQSDSTSRGLQQRAVHRELHAGRASRCDSR